MMKSIRWISSCKVNEIYYGVYYKSALFLRNGFAEIGMAANNHKMRSCRSAAGGIPERRRAVRKTFIVVIACIVLLGLLSVAGAVLFMEDSLKPEENPQIHTETEPIYNHFPGLPETSEIQWCSWTSSGIGLTTIKVYIFAFYDRDISNELQDMGIESRGEQVELYFVPEGIDGDEKWRRVENAGNAFQTGIKDTEKMNTVVYINDTGTVLYIEAIGE